MLDLLDALFVLDVFLWLVTSRIGRVFLAALLLSVGLTIIGFISWIIPAAIFLIAWIASMIKWGREDGKSFRRRRSD